MTTRLLLLAAPFALTACGQPATPAPTPAPTPSERIAPVAEPRGPGPQETAPVATGAVTARDCLGRWIGVEGMFLNVTPGTDGGVTLDMQWDLDHRGTFPGRVTAQGLRFTRGGVAEVAVRGSGDRTGLKWLAGKADCLIVKPGEGYCRA